MKVLVLGVTGMAGHTIALYFAERGHQVTGFSNTPFPHVDNIVGDATDKAGLKQILLGGYDLVINCIGILNRAADENTALAVYLNSYLPHMIAATLRDTSSRLIHMSTDCVFSGRTGGYTEKSLHDGETFYDRTKALGEVEDGVNLTFRNSIVGPDMTPAGIGLFNWFMKQEAPITGYTGAVWTGVTTLTLARAMERAAQTGLCGLYNLVNNQTVTKYDLLRLFNRAFKGGRVSISPAEGVRADKSLLCTRNDFDFSVPSYADMVDDMKAWVDAHPALYPHYAHTNGGNA